VPKAMERNVWMLGGLCYLPHVEKIFIFIKPHEKMDEAIVKTIFTSFMAWRRLKYYAHEY